MLLYSLMLSDVDAKTYEYGMLRALGFKKKHVIGVITLKSVSFSLSGMTFGIFVAFVLNIGLRMAIFLQAENYWVYELTASSIVLGVVFGLSMPIISNYFPIQAAMGKNLRQSLDLNRRNKEELGIKVERLEDAGISINQLIVSIMLIIVGFVSYYAIPYAVIQQKETLLFLLLNFILILVIIGLTFICILLFEYVERLLLWISMHTCCCKDKRLYNIVWKNMEGHRRRNAKTSIMFTLALSYMIFAASSFQITSTLISKTAKVYCGADIQANNPNGYLNEIPIANFLDTQVAAEGQPVVDYAFKTVRLSEFYEAAMYENFDSGDLDNLSDYTSLSTKIFGVPENYMNVIYNEYYVPYKMQDVSGVDDLPSGDIDPVGLLFSEEDMSDYPCYPELTQDCYGISV